MSLFALETACIACRFFTLKHGSRIFYKHGVSGKKMPWSHDEQLFERWRLGKTGMPLVDANMRELKQTGEAPPTPCLVQMLPAQDMFDSLISTW